MQRSATRSTFSTLEGGELELAINAITRAGLEPSEFALEERRTDPYALKGATVHKLISIKRIANGRQRQYVTGRGGGWPFEFERDLQCGFFGSEWPTAPGALAGIEGSR